MWIIHEPKKVALWNKQHFEEKNGECAACLKYSVLIVVEKKYIKCNIWKVSVRPSYIWDARFLKVNPTALRKPETLPRTEESWNCCSSVIFNDYVHVFLLEYKANTNSTTSRHSDNTFENIIEYGLETQVKMLVVLPRRSRWMSLQTYWYTLVFLDCYFCPIQH